MNYLSNAADWQGERDYQREADERADIALDVAAEDYLPAEPEWLDEPDYIEGVE